MTVGLKLAKNTTVKRVTFLAEGKTLSETAVQREPTWRAANMESRFERAVEKVDVKVVTYEKLEALEVPVELTVKLGQ
jgi:hypothetical protein